ncbi:MAG TPA: signal peptidase I [Candidatus Azoamicus sp. MARI]
MLYKKFLSKEYIEIYFILILILIMRLLILEPFRIPSGSMQPTLLIGDFIFVNKFIYGIHVPIINKTIKIKNPERGDVIVFKKTDKKHYIKRLIGLNGDKIIYKNKKIYINNIKIKKKIKYKISEIKKKELTKIKFFKEYLNPKKEYTIKIYKLIDTYKYNYSNIIVPKNSYFVLGDNRDNSEDSRFWGFVNQKQIKGKAFIIWLSVDTKNFNIRWNRILKYIK